MKKYYTLFVYELEHQKWFNYFGDYEKQTVIDECDDLYENLYHGILKQHMRIVKTSDQQTDIDAALDKLNGKVGLS